MKKVNYKSLLVITLFLLFQVSNLLAQDNTAEKLALKIAKAIKTKTANFPEFTAFAVSKHLKGSKIKYVSKRTSLNIEVSDTIPSQEIDSSAMEINGKYVHTSYQFKEAELNRIITELILKEKFGNSTKLTIGKKDSPYFYNIHFRGVVDSVNTGCWADGICSLTIKNHEIVWGRGWSKAPIGKFLNMKGLDTVKLEGRRVEVYCGYSAIGSSIIGSKDYYIKLLD